MRTTGQSNISTSIDVPVDKHVVVGKASLNDDNRAIFVVLTARVVD
jgi:hypothetical protein